MEIFAKYFKELTVDELYEIIKLRVDVFVVEQNCVYSDLDDCDQDAIHVFGKVDGKIVAYCRIIKRGDLPHEKIGRVLSTKRRKGYATELINKAIEVAKKEFKSEIIDIGAQVYARSLYEKIGFVAHGEEYLEDGIPHIAMSIDLSE